MTSPELSGGLLLIVFEGGPGDSGVVTLLVLGAQLRQYVGDGFDILGFDPRGMPLRIKPPGTLG